MVQCVHLICKQEKGSNWGCKHLTFLSSSASVGMYITGRWLFKADDANLLIGGLIFLHHSKKDPAHFAGKVMSWEPKITDEFAIEKRVNFNVKLISELIGTKWGETSHSRAWRSKIYEWDISLS